MANPYKVTKKTLKEDITNFTQELERKLSSCANVQTRDFLKLFIRDQKLILKLHDQRTK